MRDWSAHPVYYEDELPSRWEHLGEAKRLELRLHRLRFGNSFFCARARRMRGLRDLLEDEGDFLLAHCIVSPSRSPSDVGLRDDAEAAAAGVDDRNATYLELR